MFPTLFGPAATGDAAERARSEAILDASLAVADRGEQVRSQVRGALVEELTARLLARRVGTAAVRRERRILFDGVRAEIHPYDVTVERDGAAEAYDCKWGARGINADVLHQLDDARTHAADEDEPLRVALVVFDARRSCEVRLAPPDRAARRDRPDHARDARRAVRRPDDRPRAGRLLRAVPRPLRRGRAGRAAPDVGPAALRPGPGLVPLVGPRLRARLVRGARHHLAGPGRRGRGRRPRSGSARSSSGRRAVVGWRRVWARRRTDFVDADGAAAAVGHDRLGPARRARCCRRASRPSSSRSSARRRRRSSWHASTLGEAPAGRRPGDADRPAAGARSDGSRQQRGLRRLARGAGHRGRRPGRRALDPAPGASRVRPGGRGRRDRRGDDVAGSRRSWSCRIADADGRTCCAPGWRRDRSGRPRSRQRPDAGPDVL